MKKFMDKDFLLSTKTSRRLFHRYSKNMPIYDYHCHLNPQEIAEDKKYNNITEVWLYGDHYKWRFMRSMGVDEAYITGNKSDKEKFLAYAKCIGGAIGNPLLHWSHLELQRYFGIYDILNEENAEKIWNKANKIIESKDFSAKNLIKKSNVALIGTTDDPCDDLIWHKKIREDKDFATKVIPTFRPDNAINIEKDSFGEYIAKLESLTGTIKSFDDLKDALSMRMDHFAQMGSSLSDHSFADLPFTVLSDKEVDKIFAKGLKNKELTDEEIAGYKTAIMLFLGEEYGRRNWVMQLHLGPIRNNNTKMFEKLGADTGFDSVGDAGTALNISRFMDELDKNDVLPKTILYTLNPNMNYVLGTMLGNFQTGGIKSKIQFGSAWWFNDHIDGMREQMKTLGNLGALSCFVGMLTDSRSFLSYPRHEYFRRIMCDIVGTFVENGEFPCDEKTLKEIVENISFNNAKNYFGM